MASEQSREWWLDRIDRLKPGPLLWEELAAAVEAGAITREEAERCVAFWARAGQAMFRW